MRVKFKVFLLKAFKTGLGMSIVSQKNLLSHGVTKKFATEYVLSTFLNDFCSVYRDEHRKPVFSDGIKLRRRTRITRSPTKQLKLFLAKRMYTFAADNCIKNNF